MGVPHLQWCWGARKRRIVQEKIARKSISVVRCGAPRVSHTSRSSLARVRARCARVLSGPCGPCRHCRVCARHAALYTPYTPLASCSYSLHTSYAAHGTGIKLRTTNPSQITQARRMEKEVPRRPWWRGGTGGRKKGEEDERPAQAASRQRLLAISRHSGPSLHAAGADRAGRRARVQVHV